MTLCPCGCQQPVKPGHKLASRPCFHRLVTPEQRAAWSRKKRVSRVPDIQIPCACGCGETFSRRSPNGKRRRYLSKSHASKHYATAPEFAASQAARKAAAAAGKLRASWALVAERTAGLTPDRAYKRGYEAGYHRAMDYYKARLARVEARHRQELSAALKGRAA